MKTVQTTNSPVKRGKLSLLKVVKYASFVIGAVILISAVIIIFFPDPLINAFLKDRITNAVTDAYPGSSIRIGTLHYNIWKNRLGCDSITLKTSDPALTCSLGPFSVSGISWMKVLLQRDFTPHTLTSSVIDAQNIALNFHKPHDELRCAMLHISVPDSEMAAASIKYYSLIDDEQLFAKSRFRQTRFRFDIPQIKITGLDCPALLQGNIYNARSITMHDIFADILVNMDKPYDKNSSNPQMPNELFSSMKEIVSVDSVKIKNGRLKYSERYAVGGKPGVITFTKVNVSVTGIANHTARPDTTVIQGEGLFLNSATMKLFMAIPLTSRDFSLRYSGSLSTMDLTELNAFLEAGEYRRIKSGILQSATYSVNVTSGHAIGTLRAEYKDVSIAILNKQTGSDKGIFNRIASLFGKIFIIRGNNMPDKNGVMKIGEIKYTRDPEDYFLQYMWFALRNGIADVVGFPKKVLPD